MHNLKATAASALSLPADSYIYSIAASAPGSFSAISSDDSLRVFDAADLGRVSLVAAKTHGGGGVTSLKSYGAGDQPLLATGGRDGKVKLWDLRNATGSAVVEMQTDRNAPVLSVACSPESNTLAAGTELVSSQAVVAFWSSTRTDRDPSNGSTDAKRLTDSRDIRSPNQYQLHYSESHNDDVTELQYHPTRSNILLSGSTDGLVNIYNTTITDEDEALVQVINHGSVHHAGFLSERTIYALSHDESFSIHPATDPDSPTDDPDPVHFGDLRQPLSCEYVAQLCLGTQGAYIAAGNKIEKRLDLVPLVSSPSWQFDQGDLWRLPGAHGEEVVRSVYVDEQSKTVFTCGEDGFVRAWKQADEQDLQSEGASTKPRKQKKAERFKPY